MGIGFSVEIDDYLCSSCGKPMLKLECPHIKGELDENGKVVYALIKKVKDILEISREG